MKDLNIFIQEKLKIDKNIKIDTDELLDPGDFTEMETPGFNYNGDEVIIIGKPFKNKTTKEYLDTKSYIKNNGYTIYNDLEEIDNKEYFDWFVYAMYKEDHNNPFGDNDLDCYVYGYEGAYALEK